MQKACHPCPHCRPALCHKPNIPGTNNLHRNRAYAGIDALILCMAAMYLYRAEYRVFGHQFIAAPLQRIGFPG